MKGNINISISDDYATLSTYNYGFYYGYEFGYDEEIEEEIYGLEIQDWDSTQYRISYEEMAVHPNCPDKRECDKCLLYGIALFLELKKQNIIEKYKVVEKID